MKRIFYFLSFLFLSWSSFSSYAQSTGANYRIEGNENDLICFTINGAVIGRDNLRDHSIQVNSRQIGNIFFVAVIYGRESDLVYGYAIIGNQVIRSPLWRDTAPGEANLNPNSISWSGSNTFTISGRGTMTFSNNTWNVTPGSDARIDGSTTRINP